MIKNKEWLKNEVEDYLAIEGDYVARTALKAVLEYIDQIDEPELPVIPQFVADWIETCKGHKHNLFGVYEFAPEVVSDWIFENESKKERVDLIARAWLDGYSVGKEKRYYVYDKATKSYLGYNAVRTQLNWWTSRLEKESFTEQEIKAIDERYWAFREEVPNV